MLTYVLKDSLIVKHTGTWVCMLFLE